MPDRLVPGAQAAGQRSLLERAAAGDREAFALLYDDQVDGVYRYLLAWTGDRAEAEALTGQVFHAALGWLPATAVGEAEVGAWLIAMARDTLAQRRGSPWVGPVGTQGAASGAVAAVARLGDPEREVVVLRLLLGHSLAHTSHLSGYGQRAVMELQLAACLSIRDLTGEAHGRPTPPEAQAPPAEEFERRLGHPEVDLTGSDPALAEALAVAGSLRQSTGYVVAPAPDLVAQLRHELVTGPAVPSEGADPAGPVVSRRPWVATAIATAGIVLVLALQAFGKPAPPGTCDGRPCPASTTAAVAAVGGGSVGSPLTTVLEPSTTSTTLPAPGPAPTAPPTSAATRPPTTRPATTAPPTTAPRPTTTGAPTTTAPPTTAPTTTTAATATT
jgi:hypothetical protein